MLPIDKLNRLTESHGSLRRGTGLVSGVIALSLAILCFLGRAGLSLSRVPDHAAAAQVV